MITYTLTVVEKRLETMDTVTLCFKQPGLKKIKYEAGQYLTLTFRINGRKYVRPYSFSSAPGIDPHLEVSVKRVSGGVVSNHIFDKVIAGDIVEVMQPMGDFVVSETAIKANQHIVLWGAGSGITPLFSIAKYILANTTNKVTLVYGNRNSESVIFLDKIKGLEQKYDGTFTSWHFHTEMMVDEEHPNIIQGRIAPDKVLSIMKAEGDIFNSSHYICGPQGLKESVKASLASLHINSDRIFSEDFELVKDEKALDGITTQTVNIVHQGQRFSVEVVRGKSILEAGLDALLELPYSCQTGNCSVCRGKVINGKVRQIIARHMELQEEEYQLCCTYPLSDDVEIIVI